MKYVLIVGLASVYGGRAGDDLDWDWLIESGPAGNSREAAELGAPAEVSGGFGGGKCVSEELAPGWSYGVESGPPASICGRFNGESEESESPESKACLLYTSPSPRD